MWQITRMSPGHFLNTKNSRSLHFLNSFLKHRKIVCKGLNKQYLHNPPAVNRTSIWKVQNLNIRYADFVNQLFLSPQKYQLQYFVHNFFYLVFCGQYMHGLRPNCTTYATDWLFPQVEGMGIRLFKTPVMYWTSSQSVQYYYLGLYYPVTSNFVDRKRWIKMRCNNSTKLDQRMFSLMPT